MYQGTERHCCGDLQGVHGRHGINVLNAGRSGGILLPRFRPQNDEAANDADELSLSEKTIRRWIKNECLHVHRLGRVIRIAREDLTAFIGRHRQ